MSCARCTKRSARSAGSASDSDLDGVIDPLDDPTSFAYDADGDTYADEVDVANEDSCDPDPLATACAIAPASVSVPLFGPHGMALMGLLLTALGIRQVRRRQSGASRNRGEK